MSQATFTHAILWGGLLTAVLAVPGTVCTGASQGTSTSTSTTVAPPETVEDFESGLTAWEWSFWDGEPASATVISDTPDGSDGALAIWFPEHGNNALQITDSGFGPRWSAGNYSQITMWVKTAVRKLARRLPLSPEIQAAAAADETFDDSMDTAMGEWVDGDVVDVGDPEQVTEAIQRSAKPASEDPASAVVFNKELHGSADYEKIMQAFEADPELAGAVLKGRKIETAADLKVALKDVTQAFDEAMGD